MANHVPQSPYIKRHLNHNSKKDQFMGVCIRVNEGLFHCLVWFACVICCFPDCSTAQTTLPDARGNTKSIPPSKQNIKILEEHKDGKGNIIRTIQYEQGNKKVTETTTTPIATQPNIKLDSSSLLKDSLLIVVTKSRNRLDVFYKKQMVRSYKAVFGPRPLENKTKEGDRCTPEGWFTIQEKNPKSHYNKFLLLNYPNDSTMARLDRLKEKGLVPKNAKPGSAVGIHGVWHKGDDMVEKGIGWTDGCIAIKNKDIDELYSLVALGVRVFIKK